MIEQSFKDLYFSLNRWVALPVTWVRRVRFRDARDLALNLGAGDDGVAGMLNVDGNMFRRGCLWLDLRNPLPFADGSAAFVYCCHVLEHLYPREALFLLSEIRRCLSTTGVARIAVPSFEHCLLISQGKAQSAWPREMTSPSGQAINYLLCDGQHKYAYSEESLIEFCTRAGFSHITPVPCEASRYAGIALRRESPGSIVVELRP